MCSNGINYIERYLKAIDKISFALGHVAKICDKCAQGKTFDKYFKEIISALDEITLCFMLLKLQKDGFLIFNNSSQ